MTSAPPPPWRDTTSAPSPPWIELPKDVTANILCRLGPEEMLNTAERVCTTWRSVCGEPSLWRVFRKKYPYELDTPALHGPAGIICRRAVDRSQGQMIELNINFFASDDLLRYISVRSCHLKILSLEDCEKISGKGLAAAVKNFYHLEELHLFLMWKISGLDIEKIGDSCPTLKSFTFYNPHLSVFRQKSTDNSDALSIAKKMPNLVRLCLFGNMLNNEGLQAILNGCPKLESLDLGRCLGVDLHCDGLGRRFWEQIKELRYPSGDCVNGQFYDPEPPPNNLCGLELYFATLEEQEMQGAEEYFATLDEEEMRLYNLSLN